MYSRFRNRHPWPARPTVTQITSALALCGSALMAGTLLLAGCNSQPSSAAADPPAGAAEPTPRAEQALLEDLAVANPILTKELANLHIQAHVTPPSPGSP